MGRVNVNGIELYYEVYGEGVPLVLIEGLGYSSWMWYKQIEELSRDFKVIVFDNRGVGKSDKPDIEYTIELFADDLAELLTKLKIDKAHTLGVSMGGFVAQEFALKYPDMVDKLILVSTSFGGPNCVLPSMDTLNIMIKGGGAYESEEEIRNAVAVALYKDNLDKNEDVLNKIIIEKSSNPQPKYAYQRQMLAGASFNAEERVSKIKSETLIMAGEGDRVVPHENAKLLYDKIAHSRLEIIKGGGHVFFMEEAEVANKIIKEFLI